MASYASPWLILHRLRRSRLPVGPGLGYQRTHLENHWRLSILIMSTVLISLVLFTLFSPFASARELAHSLFWLSEGRAFLLFPLDSCAPSNASPGWFVFAFYFYFGKDSYYFGFTYKTPEFHSYLAHL
jgi:hypothetical protein